MPNSASDQWPTANGAVRATTPSAVRRRPTARRFKGAMVSRRVTPPKSRGTDCLVSSRHVGTESCLKPRLDHRFFSAAATTLLFRLEAVDLDQAYEGASASFFGCRPIKKENLYGAVAYSHGLRWGRSVLRHRIS